MKNLLVLTLLAAAVLTAIAILPSGSSAQTPDYSVDEVAIDVDVTGNGDNVLGPTESCSEAPLGVGNSIDVDVIVRGVAGDPRLFGIGFSFLFDPDVLQVDEVRIGQTPSMMAGDLLYAYLDYDSFGPGESPPGTTGKVRVDWVQQTVHAPPETGDGVLVRVSLTAVGEGVSPLSLGPYEFDQTVGPPGVLWVEDTTGELYTIDSLAGASVVVGGGDCLASTPTPTLSPTETVRPTPTSSVDPTTLPPTFSPTPSPHVDPATVSPSPSPTLVIVEDRFTPTPRSSQPVGPPPLGGEPDGGRAEAALAAIGALAMIAAAGAYVASSRRR